MYISKLHLQLINKLPPVTTHKLLKIILLKMQRNNYDPSNLIKSLSCEYKNAREKKNNNKITKHNNNKQRTIRIFISSTFRDFHNERNLLVTKVFPRLREWCANHGLYLVECDLRWGIPADSSREQTLMTCFDEIEKGKQECNEMNFFLGLIGDRYGWIPNETEITENIRKRYKWIEGSSVTLMEVLHGMIRTLTPNGLLMLRLPDFIKDLPDNMRSEFMEKDPKAISNLNVFKEFLKNTFEENNSIHFYSASYDGVVYDKFIGQKRVLVKLDDFEDQVEKHFIKCIKENFLPFKEEKTDNMDEVHEIMVECLTNQNPIPHETYQKLFDTLKGKLSKNDRSLNSIFMLSGEAGSGKSTTLAHCAKVLKTLPNCDSFFHSFSCTSNSMYNTTICERLYRFLSIENLNPSKSFVEKKMKISHLLENGPKRQDKDVFYVFLDGIDEMSSDQTLEWLPKFTSNRIVIIISCLLDTNSSSFYSQLLDSDKSISEISIQAMPKTQLCEMVKNYLDSFGKKLDVEQLNCLMSFKSSNNPLWLISACEELRIHGDYFSLTKFILSLPATIYELNKVVLKRLMNQDSKNILKTFLQLLAISKSGLWESLIKNMLATKLNSAQPLSHSLWTEIVCHLKGFLLIQSMSVPLIKFRHRVMKSAIEEELAMSEKFKLNLHYEMSVFFENTIDNSGDLFLADYIYHLIKSNSRNRLMKFIRSRKSWRIFKSPFVRGKIVSSMRCINRVVNVPSQKVQELMMCRSCTFVSGELAEHAMNKNSCYFCGTFVFNNNGDIAKLFPCQIHKHSGGRLVNCVLCESPIGGKGENIKVCQMCKSLNFSGSCGVLVKEEDMLFHQQLEFSNSVYQIESLI